eukprot:EG_transcript_5906
MGCSIVTASPRRPIDARPRPGHDDRYEHTAQSSSALWVGPASSMSGTADGATGGPPSPTNAARPRRSPRLCPSVAGGAGSLLGDTGAEAERGRALPTKRAVVIHGPDPEEVPPSPGAQTPLMSPSKGPAGRLGESSEYDGSASEVEDRPLSWRRRARTHSAAEEALSLRKLPELETALPSDPSVRKPKHRLVGLSGAVSKSPIELPGGSSTHRPHPLAGSPPHPSGHALAAGHGHGHGHGHASSPPAERAGLPKPSLDWRGAMQAEIVSLSQHAQAVEHRLAALMDAHQRLLLDPGPEDFLCPILREVMIDPVVTSDGHTYERSAIVEWFSRRHTSPLTNQPLTDLRLIPNHALRRQILQWRERAQVPGSDAERPASAPAPVKASSVEEPDTMSSAMTTPSNNTTSLAHTAASDFSFHPTSLQPSVSASLSVDSDTASSASFLSQGTAGSAVEAAATVVAPAPLWPASPDSPSERSCRPDSVHSYRSARSEFSAQSSRPPTAS